MFNPGPLQTSMGEQDVRLAMLASQPGACPIRKLIVEVDEYYVRPGDLLANSRKQSHREAQVSGDRYGFIENRYLIHLHRRIYLHVQIGLGGFHVRAAHTNLMPLFAESFSERMSDPQRASEPIRRDIVRNHL